MNRPTTWSDDLEAVDLQELLNAKTQQTLSGQPSQNRQQALVELAQEAVGWQNWARKNSVPLMGNPMVLTQRAATEMGAGVSEANAAFAEANVQHPMPDLYNQGGDAACWQRVATINPEIYQACCPPELQFCSNKPEPSGRQGNSSKAQDEPHPVHAAEPSSPPPPSIRVEVEPPDQAFLSPEQQRDRTLAQLGREIVNIAGTEDGGKLAFEGKANYTIIVNLNTNTMRITAKDRGKDPILIDANGKIDHGNSQVTDRDVEKFKQVLQKLHSQQPSMSFDR